MQKETSHEAIKREIKEEVNCDVITTDLFAITENIFERKDKKIVQELGMYYFIKPSDDIILEDRVFIETDNKGPKKLEFKWISLEDLDKENFKPEFLVKQIKEFNKNLKYYNYKK